MRARSMTAREPTRMEPTGAPRPLERQKLTVSKPRVSSATRNAESDGGVEDASAVEMRGQA